MMACQMVKIVAQYERTCTNQLGPHGHCGDERPGGCAQINFPSGFQTGCPNAMDQLLLLKLPEMGTTGRPVGAGINSANDSHTGPDFEANFSGSPTLPCPTAKHSSKSEPSSQKIRREDQPMSLSPGAALELRCLW
jgi:hypothetical protein